MEKNEKVRYQLNKRHLHRCTSAPFFYFLLGFGYHDIKSCHFPAKYFFTAESAEVAEKKGRTR
jgi:hypothetical protein